MMISCSPEATASSTTYWMVGLSTRGSISFGWALVAGRNRVPSPAAGNTPFRTFMRALPSPAAAGRSSGRSAPPHAFQHRDDGEDAHRLREEERRLVGGGDLQQDRGDAEGRGEEQDQQHARGLRH